MDISRNIGLLAGVLFLMAMSWHVVCVDSGWIASRRLLEQFCYTVVFLSAALVSGRVGMCGRVLAMMGGAGVIASLWGMGQYVQGMEAYSTLGNRNFFATFLLFAVGGDVWWMGWHIRQKRHGWGAACALSAGLCIVALYLCGSKAAWIALISSTLLLLALQQRWKVLGAALIGIALGMSVLPWERIVVEIHNDVRPCLWDGALKMGWSRIGLGWGVGHFFVHFPSFRSVEYFLMGKSADTTLHAHNGFFEICAEMGLPGLVLFVIVLYLVGRKLAAAVSSRDGSMPASALWFMCVAFCIKGFLDMDFEVVSSSFYFWLVLGLAAGLPSQNAVVVVPGTSQQSPEKAVAASENAGIVSKTAAAAALGCAVIFSALCFIQYTIPFVRAQWLSKKASNMAQGNRWVEAQQYLEQAVRIESDWVDGIFRLGYAYTRTGQWDKALDCYQQVQRIAPYYSNVMFNMAAVHKNKGDYGRAMQCLQEGFSVNPYSLPGHDIAREIFLLIGQVEKARREELLIKAIETVKKQTKA